MRLRQRNPAIFPEKIDKILFYKQGGIGDMIMATPALRALRERFQHSKIVVLTETGRAQEEVIKGTPLCDEIIPFYRRENWKRHPLALLSLIIKLRKKRFDLAIGSHSDGKFFLTALLFFLIGARWRVGFKSFESRWTKRFGFLYHIWVPLNYFPSKHVIEYNLDLLKAIGINATNTGLMFPIGDKEKEFATEFFHRNGLDGVSPVVAIFNGCSKGRETLLYPDEKLIMVMETLIEKYRAKILLIGGERERWRLEKIKENMKGRVVIAAGQSLRETAALIERTKLLITTDSGINHIGVALHIPTICLFGPSYWVETGYEEFGSNYIAITKRLSCGPCFRPPDILGCKERPPQCMKQITPQDVLRACSKFLEKYSDYPYAEKAA
jgi:heptosyltransferase-2